jgi:hypothetical protein
MPKSKWRRILFDSAYQVVTWIWIGMSIGSYFYYLSKASSQGALWSMVSLVCSGVVMIVLVASQYFGEGQDPKRPELYIHETRMLPLEPGKPETVLLDLRNRGTTTARNVRLWPATHAFLPNTVVGPLQYHAPKVTDVRPDIGVGEVNNTIVSSSPVPLSKEKIRELQDGETLFFHFGEGEYEGDDGTVYPFDFCYMYWPQSAGVPRICPEKYWPKDRALRIPQKRPHLATVGATATLGGDCPPP